MSNGCRCKEDVLKVFLATAQETQVVGERIFKNIKEYPLGESWGWGRKSAYSHGCVMSLISSLSRNHPKTNEKWKGKTKTAF